MLFRSLPNQGREGVARSIKVVALTMACVFTPVFVSSLHAAETKVSCKDVLVRAQENNLIGSVTLDAEWGLVRVSLPDLHCVEPIEEWRRRGQSSWPVSEGAVFEVPKGLGQASKPKTLPPAPKPTKPAPKPASAPKPKPAPNPAPKPARSLDLPAPEAVTPKPEKGFTPHPMFDKTSAEKPTHSVLKGVQGPVVPPSPGTGQCDLKVGTLWPGGRHKIEDVPYWLEHVHAIDRDGDGITDNVGFKFVSMDETETVRQHSYFSPTRDLAVQALSDLALPSPSVVGRICFGEASFPMPARATAKPETAESLSIRPDLAAEQRAVAEGKKTLDEGGMYEPGQKDEEGISIWVWVGIIAFAFLSMGLGVYLILYLVRKARKSKLHEDEGEDEYDEEEDGG